MDEIPMAADDPVGEVYFGTKDDLPLDRTNPLALFGSSWKTRHTMISTINLLFGKG